MGEGEVDGTRARAYALTGRDAAAALDWLHVHAELCAVHEDDERIAVYVRGELPTPPFGELAVRELAPADGPPPTGLEDDRVLELAPDLIVRPPWVARPAGFEGCELVVPRGGAFGSGEHESTQAALLCLHALWDAPASFADVGCGSGILALYARRRGCPVVQACDVDEPSVRAAAALLPGALVRRGGPTTLSAADAVAANMTAAELHACLDEILALWTRRGPLVLAGMRPHEVADIAARLPAAPAWTVVRPPFHALGLQGN